MVESTVGLALRGERVGEVVTVEPTVGLTSRSDVSNGAIHCDRHMAVLCNVYSNVVMSEATNSWWRDCSALGGDVPACSLGVAYSP